MADLTGAQKASFIDALLSGYTSDDQLAELLALRLDVNLAEIAGDGTLREQAFAVVNWAVANGRTRELALQAQASRPGNGKLTALVDSLYPGERQQASPESGAGNRAAPKQRRWIFAAVAVAAILIVVFVIALRPRGDGGGGNGGSAGKSGNSGGKDPSRPPVTMRFTTVSAFATAQTPPRVVVDARFQPPQLAPGAVLFFVVGSGPRCGKQIDRARVDNPSLGFMTFVLGPERERVTCAQLFVEDANGQTIARSDPHNITF
jgi:hypothetical protein